MTMNTRSAPGSPRIDEQQVRDILRQIIDPEVGMNIVALGLIYRIDIAPDQLTIEMTMTSPACPMGTMLVDDVCAALLEALPAGIEADVRLVWDPPWNPSLMEQAAKQHFGWAS